MTETKSPGIKVYLSGGNTVKYHPDFAYTINMKGLYVEYSTDGDSIHFYSHGEFNRVDFYYD